MRQRLSLTFLYLAAVQFAFASPVSAQTERTVTAADMPRIPHTESADAVKTFQVAKGFQLELVAAEPLVGDPVAACFDAAGRMYVAEMHGYPFSQEPTKLNPAGGGKKDAGIIRLLEDTDGDGKMDRSVVFADKISWPTSLCCYNGGLFVIAPQFLYYFKDTDDDGKADVREVVLSGFGRGNVQSVTNGLLWGLDNRIYFAAGRNPKDLKHRGKPMFSVGSGDLSFDPRSESFARATGGLQFGHSTDNWGVRFVCSNSNHIQQVIYPQGYLSRNPQFVASGLIRSIASDGASARVFRISPPEPWRIVRQKWRALDKGYRLVFNDQGGWEFIPLDPSKKQGGVPTEYPVGFFTSATGITIYTGDAYPAPYRGNAFVGDVGGNLVHRKTLETDKVAYRATRADQGEEFIASTDNWFRPVNFVNAPDGTLYVLDMYRETVEHPYSIPTEIKKFLRLSSGDDRGRIYRLVSPGMKRRKLQPLNEMSVQQLVTQLQSASGWHRQTAQRLLWERNDPAAVEPLSRLLAESDQPLGRLHALCTLHGLEKLTEAHVLKGLRDEHPRVRAHAIRLSESQLNNSDKILDALADLTRDANEHVRFQLAFSLGESTKEQAVESLAAMAGTPMTTEVRTAWLSSVGKTADRLTASLLADKEFLAQSHAAPLLTQLMLILGAQPEPQGALRVLAIASNSDLPLATQQLLLGGLGQGAARRGSSLQRLLESPQASDDLKKQVAKLFERAADIVRDSERPSSDRVAAIQLLGFGPVKTSSAALASLLTPQTTQAFQLQAVRALVKQPGDDVAQTLLQRWRTFSPNVRREVVDGLMSRPGRIVVLLEHVAAGDVKRGDIERDKKQQLLSHPNEKLRGQAKKLLGGEVNSDRAKVVAQFQSVLELASDKERGLAVFKQKCAVCHQVGKVGHQVAPNLASVKNKSTADLLTAILDPNREAQPNFNVYNVQTEDGETLSGMIAAETENSVTLRRAEGKQDVILRSNIARMASTGVSLMPEGLEKDLTAQHLADVIAFIKSIPATEPTK